MCDRLGMRPISEDLRQRIIQKRGEGYRASELSSLFGVSVRSVQRYCKRYRERGTVSADKKGRPEGSKLDACREPISGWIQKEPGLTLEQLCERCRLQLALSVHHTTLLRVLRRWGYRYKKNALCQGAEPG